jgi:succinate dehydrogenase flavin-adding protein (antitoxin of CptAB toxin-antitoxin module)
MSYEKFIQETKQKPAILLRIDHELYEWVTREAKKHKTSRNKICGAIIAKEKNKKEP